MKKLLKSIDIAQMEMHGEFVYRIEGWTFFKDGRDFELKLLADGEIPVPFQMTTKPRPDLKNVLKNVTIPQEPGYTILIPKIGRVIEEYGRLELIVEAQGERESLFCRTSLELLKEYEWVTLFFKVDTLDLLGGQMVIQGWVIDQYEQDSIAVKDEHGQEIEHQIERFVRQDVNEGCKLENKDYKCAFNIAVQRESIRSEELHVQFSNRYVTKEYVVNMKQFDYEQSKRGRLKKALAKENKDKNKAYIKEHGWKGFYYYLQSQMDPHYADYTLWVKRHSASKKELRRQREYRFPYTPLISVVIPLYNTPLDYLKEILDSLTGQTYSNLEICLADGSTEDAVGAFIRKEYGRDPRVRYQRLKENKGISENTNAALSMASGDYIMLSDHDDVVTPDALFEIVKVLNKEPDTDIVYTDEDKVTMDGKKYFEPSFKPDFNLDLLRSNNYICHIFVVKKRIMDEIGGFRKEFDGAQDFDLILRCVEKSRIITHIPKVLYHWRSHPGSTAGNPGSKRYAFEAGRKALKEHYDRLGIDAKTELTQIFGRYRTRYQIHGEPLVSIIIPNMDHVDDLDQCLKSVVAKTTYPNYEILVVENNSQLPETFVYYQQIEEMYENLRVIHWPDEFNYAAINNFAAREAKGEYYLFLNNDVEIIDGDWMEEMLGICQRDDVGIVGAKLYFPDNTVQHAGVVIGLGGVAGHIFTGLPRREYGYGARLVSTQDYSAVTAACMMTPAAVFQSVGGFDEGFQVAFNDVDYCMKVRALGRLVVFTPYAQLFHYESKSRGKEETAEQLERFHGEIDRFEKKWPAILRDGDPYYNKNLTLRKGDCSLRQEGERWNERSSK
ncbi:MAG: glycosyltransferase family 2 protein [Blautia sp.]|jgi:GT2 family glycosyltransferase